MVQQLNAQADMLRSLEARGKRTGDELEKVKRALYIGLEDQPASISSASTVAEVIQGSTGMLESKTKTVVLKAAAIIAEAKFGNDIF